MIKRSLEYLTDELAFGLGIDNSDVNLDSLKKLQEDSAPGIVITLLNVEEESTLKNSPHFIRKNNQILYKEPPVFLNLNILMAFKFEDYGTSLQRLEETVNFFQSRRRFGHETARDDNPFPADVGKLILDLQHLNFEHLNHIWSISGGTHFLSLLYRVRLVKIQPADETEGPEIDTIQLNSGLM